ncbi:MAG: methyltransferase domain-containing protein [Patescibacteria group bacterium]
MKSLLPYFYNLTYFKVLEWNLRDCRNVLDVGCGSDSPIGHIPHTFISEGIDAYKKSIDKSKKKKLHDHYRIGNIMKLNSFYKRKSFDAVVCLDVIEHLKPKDTVKLIHLMESIAIKKVILLTPNGFYHQHALEGNIYQVHQSGWKAGDLADLGYKVFGLRGLQLLRDDHASIKYRPWIFWGFCSFISEIIFYPFPGFCFDLFAVKNMR